VPFVLLTLLRNICAGCLKTILSRQIVPLGRLLENTSLRLHFPKEGLGG
jgi:hypothetical protein